LVELRIEVMQLVPLIWRSDIGIVTKTSSAYQFEELRGVVSLKYLS